MGHDRTMAPTLALLAAGMGSRYGGPKQLEPVGRDGEPLFVLTARDALQGGFDRIVVVTRGSLEAAAHAIIDTHLQGCPLEVIVQDTAPPTRAAPWGTAHAAVVCASVVDGPLAVANADDLYGSEPLARLAAETSTLDPTETVLVGYRLGDTLSSNGPVNRAICRLDDGWVVGLSERQGLWQRGSDVVDAGGETVSADSPVSMNLFGLGVSVLAILADRFTGFAASHPDDDVEMSLPDELGVLLASGVSRMRWVAGGHRWAGLTCRDDLEVVRAAVAAAEPMP